MAFVTHTVGRSASADIHISDDSVSRLHLEITQTSQGQIFCLDRNSTCGSFVLKDNQWVPFSQGFLDQHTVLKLGKKTLRLQQLLRVKQTPDVTALQDDIEPISIKPRRNTATGEVERKR